MAKKKKKIDKRNDIVIKDGIAIYTVSHQSLNQGTLIGQFTFKCYLLPLEKLAVGREKRELLGQFDVLATEDEKFLAYALTSLKYRVISAPSFWTTSLEMNGNIPEESLIFKILDAAFYAEALYAEQKEDEKEALIKAAFTQAEKIIKKKKEEDEQKSEDDEDDVELEDEK